ncbi:fungal-specific transcription factor domain-containing protein [Lipomyces chichibuensis]|uniref:fungal-specific transcription factor domain-containing protein n=1 Tax=Lipomyces chichibuensis TaxID=1546026 RepID=UPI0033437494
MLDSNISTTAADAAAATGRNDATAARQQELDEEYDNGFDIDENDFDPDDEESDDLIKGGAVKTEDGADADMHGTANPMNPTPIQKRRRVTRACDECRRKKIKCDGKQPCTHCTVYSYECTYDQPSNRRRNPAPFYIHQLESRLQQSIAVLQALIPGVDIYKSGFDIPRFLSQLKANANPALTETASAALQAANSQMPTKLPTATVSTLNDTVTPSPSLTNTATPQDRDTNIESMVVSLGRLDVDETGHLDYVGHSSGRAFLQHVRAHFLNDHPDCIPADLPKTSSFHYSPEGDKNSAGATGIDDSPSDYYYYQQMAEFKIILPTKEVALQLINAVWDQACIVIRFGHRPTIQRRLDELYATDPDDYTPAQISFLPLVYCFLAVGVLFTQNMRDPDRKEVGEGYKYFVAARKMIDITEARDTDAIQAVILMIMFLQSTARLSTCYSYIGVALRAALRLGLHRKVAYSFSPVEAEIRKRVFWTIRKMDIHVSAMLGLPRCIDENDIDQEQPLEIDDEYITETGILPHPVGVITQQLIANVHTRLMAILSHIVEDVYPIKPRTPVAQPGAAATNCVSYVKVLELENDLQHWVDALPFELRPGIDPPKKWYIANRLLNMAFCYVKVILYRPFIHYVGQKYKDKMTDERPYACAANCISTSRIVVHLADELIRRDVLRGAHLFSVYTIFFSTAVLIYYVHEDPYNPHVHEFRKDAELGKNVINKMKNKSAAAARTYVMLSGLFELLNKRMATIAKTGGTPDDSKRKRRSDSAQAHQTELGTLQRSDNIPQRPIKPSAGVPHFQPPQQSQQFPHANLHAGGMNTSAPRVPPLNMFAGMGNSGENRSPAFVPTPAPSYDEFFPRTEASGGYADTITSPTPISQSVMPGVDVSDLTNATLSNVNTMLYFPSLGTSANTRVVGNDFSQTINPASGEMALAPGSYDPNTEISAAAMMAYSAGPMDQLEAQLFGRFLPPYMYQQPQQSMSAMQVQPQPQVQSPKGVKSPSDLVVDMGAVLGGGGPFLQDNVEDARVSLGTPLSAGSSGTELALGYAEPGQQQQQPQPQQPQPQPLSLQQQQQQPSWGVDANVTSQQGNMDQQPMTQAAEAGFLGAIPDDWDEFLSHHSELSGLKNLMMH